MDTSGQFPVSLLLRVEALAVALVGLTTFIMARIERRHVLSYGFSGSRKLSLLGIGLVAGVFCMTLLILLLWKLRFLEIRVTSVSAFDAFRYGLAWGLALLLVAIFEEALFRGYLQFTLTQAIGYGWAAILLSFVFAITHASNRDESFLGILEIFLAGALACLSLWVTRSLFWAVGFHAGWDWTQSFLFGTPDSGMLVKGTLMTTHSTGNSFWSGGGVGPEGSFLVVPLYFLLALGIWFGLRPKFK
jgi:membrane protease YdiL (CAAX protease family)